MSETRARAHRPGAVLALQVLSLLLALTLLGFLPALTSRLGRTVCPKEPQDLVALADAIRGYAREHDGRAPATLEELVDWIDLDSIPRDSWGRPYLYEPLFDGSGSVRIACLGADGLPGGEGEDQDCELRVLPSSR